MQCRHVRRSVANVKRHSPEIKILTFAQLNYGSNSIRISTVDNNNCTLVCKRSRGSKTNTAGRASNECNAPIEFKQLL